MRRFACPFIGEGAKKGKRERERERGVREREVGRKIDR